MWRSGNEMAQPVGGPGLNSGQKLVFFLELFSFLVFPFHVGVFLVIVVCFASLL